MSWMDLGRCNYCGKHECNGWCDPSLVRFAIIVGVAGIGLLCALIYAIHYVYTMPIYN